MSETDAKEYLDRLDSSSWARRTLADIDYEQLAERLAHLAWAWNNDPDHIADLLGDGGMDAVFANAAVCVLRVAAHDKEQAHD